MGGTPSRLGRQGNGDASRGVSVNTVAMAFPLIPESHLAGPPDPERRLRFMEVVRRRMRERRYSPRTEKAYAYWIRRYIVHHGRRHPRELGVEHVREFLSALATADRVAAATQ